MTHSPITVLVVLVCLCATGCGQRAARTDLAIQPLPSPIVPSVLVDLQPHDPSAIGAVLSGIGGSLLPIVPIASGFAPSLGDSNTVWTNPETGVQDRKTQDGRLSLEPTEALRLNLLREMQRTHVAATVYPSPADLPVGVTPTITIRGTVAERTAWRCHHSGCGIFWYTPLAIVLPHSTSSVAMDADVTVSNASGQVLWEGDVEADDAYRLHLFYWQVSARRNARTFARTVLATEVAQEMVRNLSAALTATTKP